MLYAALPVSASRGFESTPLTSVVWHGFIRRKAMILLNKINDRLLFFVSLSFRPFAFGRLPDDRLTQLPLFFDPMSHFHKKIFLVPIFLRLKIDFAP